MRIDRLRIANLRNIRELDIELSSGLNYFVGPNGAGKTSLIEGAYLLSYGSSFRASQNGVLENKNSSAQLAINADVSRIAGPVRLSMALDVDGWSASVNNTRVPQLATALAEFALVCFEPGSHQLISGGSAERRRFFDWMLFHVEHSYLSAARAFRRVLQQRNALLKNYGSDSELDVWDAEFSTAATVLAKQRAALFPLYAIELSKILSIFLPELGASQVSLRKGWADDEELGQALFESRAQDRLRGHTTRGPHRADWTIRFEQAQSRDHLSRGQEKLCALACMLAQAEVFASHKREWPTIALDDFASELDAAHQRITLDWLATKPAQIVMTGVDRTSALSSAHTRLFHVEHGHVKPLI
jgi:DNA replication and repair protein RecF